MKTGIRLLLILLFSAGFIGLTVWRNHQIVAALDAEYGIETRYHMMGEIIPFGENHQDYDDEPKDGYSIRVDNAEILSYDELLVRFDLDDEDVRGRLGSMASMLPEKVCLISATMFNENSLSDTGPSLALISCSGVNYDMYQDGALTIMVNESLRDIYQDNLMANAAAPLEFTLKAGEGEAVYLVYDYYRGFFNARHWEHLADDTLDLDLTWYPVKERVSIHFLRG